MSIFPYFAIYNASQKRRKIICRITNLHENVSCLVYQCQKVAMTNGTEQKKRCCFFDKNPFYHPTIFWYRHTNRQWIYFSDFCDLTKYFSLQKFFLNYFIAINSLILLSTYLNSVILPFFVVRELFLLWDLSYCQ